ncbi:hypothetical protein G9H72_15900 [Motilibacter sp. K478]|nr:hypothetical protein [Motilibacter aurantiacus]
METAVVRYTSHYGHPAPARTGGRWLPTGERRRQRPLLQQPGQHLQRRRTRSVQLEPLPAFLGDQLMSSRTGGDLLIQMCADDPQVPSHASLQMRAFCRSGEAGLVPAGLTSPPTGPPTGLCERRPAACVIPAAGGEAAPGHGELRFCQRLTATPACLPPTSAAASCSPHWSMAMSTGRMLCPRAVSS